MTVASAVNPFEKDLPFGTVVPSVNVLDWQVGQQNCDLRPRLVDKSTGEARMIDTGSMITATKRLPGDQRDQNLKLLAVNGSEIETYGLRKIQFQINRKTYEMQAIICDIAQDILGMDFMTKYKLGFDWDGDQLMIIDKKAQIKSPLEVVTVPVDFQRIHYLKPGSRPAQAGQVLDEASIKRSNDAIAFQVSCVQKLDQSNNSNTEKNEDIEEKLKLHDE